MTKHYNYLIQFAGLKIGKHLFEYEITDSFFKLFEYSEIKKGNLSVKVKLDKQETMLSLEFHVKGYVNVNCDRCNELFDLEIEGTYPLIIKYGNEIVDESDEMLIIPRTAHEINIDHYIYEAINLLIPYKRIHPDDKNGKSTCDPEMIEKLNQFLKRDDTEEETDPRWAKLNKLKNEN